MSDISTGLTCRRSAADDGKRLQRRLRVAVALANRRLLGRWLEIHFGGAGFNTVTVTVETKKSLLGGEIRSWR